MTPGFEFTILTWAAFYVQLFLALWLIFLLRRDVQSRRL